MPHSSIKGAGRYGVLSVTTITPDPDDEAASLLMAADDTRAGERIGEECDRGRVLHPGHAVPWRARKASTNRSRSAGDASSSVILSPSISSVMAASGWRPIHPRRAA